MADQLALDLVLPPLAPPDPTIQDRAEAFFAANRPLVMWMLRHAQELRDAGARRISAKYLFERARVERLLAVRTDERWALNNSLSSRLARLLVKADPSLAGLIETRALRAA